MTFLLGKAFWTIAAPGNFLVLLLAVGTLLLLLSRGRRGIGLVAAGTAGFLIIWTLPVGEWLLLPLENRLPPPKEMPLRVDGIIVLGGAVDPAVSEGRGQIKLNEAANRLTAGVVLARRYPAARIVLSGGSGLVISGELPEADAMREFLVEQGIDPARVTEEARSRTTYENVQFAFEVARPRPGETWLLVTSAAHMPRAVGCFRRIGWTVIPFPVDYRTSGRVPMVSDLTLSEGLVRLTLAVREWLGLAAYRVLGRTDALFPGPA